MLSEIIFDICMFIFHTFKTSLPYPWNFCRLRLQKDARILINSGSYFLVKAAFIYWFIQCVLKHWKSLSGNRFHGKDWYLALALSFSTAAQVFWPLFLFSTYFITCSFYPWFSTMTVVLLHCPSFLTIFGLGRLTSDILFGVITDFVQEENLEIDIYHETEEHSRLPATIPEAPTIHVRTSQRTQTQTVLQRNAETMTESSDRRLFTDQDLIPSSNEARALTRATQTHLPPPKVDKKEDKIIASKEANSNVLAEKRTTQDGIHQRGSEYGVISKRKDEVHISKSKGHSFHKMAEVEKTDIQESPDDLDESQIVPESDERIRGRQINTEDVSYSGERQRKLGYCGHCGLYDYLPFREKVTELRNPYQTRSGYIYGPVRRVMKFSDFLSVYKLK